MDFSFSEEQNLLRETFREFSARELGKEYVRWLDENRDFPPEDLLAKIGDLGFFGITIPEEYGGAGAGMIELCIALEELSAGSGAVALAAALAPAFGGRPIGELGTEEQKQEHLPQIARGEEKWCMALTEPAGGTDILGAISTTAVRKGGEYIVNGSKMFISGAHVADYILLIAITDREAKRSRGLSILLVDAQSPGITINLIRKLGVHACGAAEVHFEDVQVPARNLLGEENMGWYHLLGTLNPERVGVAAIMLGGARTAFADALEYSGQREAFGKPIGQFQIIQHYLADIAIEIENARNLVYKCAWLCDSGGRYDVEATMVKIVACRAVEKAALYGMEIFGGYGFTMEYDMQRHFRDYRQGMFSPISNEMSMNYIAQSFGLPKSY
ncbi:MAG: acyl-CoA dehydrogenase [Actinobacteria bacterium]|jgi:alkylation response protein AidB-like acyl-CoA dehydrogenase|nr:MAG: acyl-CoA dehydrogenase [Actinomycetota bacterium]